MENTVWPEPVHTNIALTILSSHLYQHLLGRSINRHGPYKKSAVCQGHVENHGSINNMGEKVSNLY